MDAVIEFCLELVEKGNMTYILLKQKVQNGYSYKTFCIKIKETQYVASLPEEGII